MTKQRALIVTTVAVLFAGVLVFAGERFYKSSPTQKSGDSTNLNELRARLNADKGKVRLLMLLSPT